MRIGIGLPAAVPGADMTTLGRWAAESERAGFAAVGVIDRLVYANLDPLIALAVAAGRTERVDLVTTVLSIGWRNNPILVAKQMASLDLASGGRLLAGLGLGGWPEDYLASQVPQAGSAAGWDSSLAAMRQVWDGKLRGQGGPTPELPEGRPALLFGGLVPAAYRRAVAHGQGWVAPLFGLPVLQQGAAAVQEAWAAAGRPAQPRIVTGRYFSLGEDADAVADDYVRHYYGDHYFAPARADTLTTTERLGAELAALEGAGRPTSCSTRLRAGSNRAACWPRPCGRPGSRRPATPDLPVETEPAGSGRRGCDQRRAADDRRRVGVLLLAAAVVVTRAALWEGPVATGSGGPGRRFRSPEATIQCLRTSVQVLRLPPADPP
jgi:alkanesulfonate monooxygenase SsuD/methylene tetrahydromethanopterin reductase-like flavin-dependent oxidoreductase (luciferase family)